MLETLIIMLFITLMFILLFIHMDYISNNKAPEEENKQMYLNLKNEINLMQAENKKLKIELDEVKEILVDLNKVVKDQQETITNIGLLFSKLDGFKDELNKK